MGRMYSVSFEDVAVSVVQDLFQIQSANALLTLHGITLTQTSDTDDERVGLVLKRVTDTVTNVAAEVPLDDGNTQAAGANIRVNETTQIATGAAIIWADAFNVLAGFVWLPTPEMRPNIRGNTFALDMDAPGSALTMSGTLVFEESG